LIVTGQGTWTVNPVTGAITFTPEAGYTGDPTPVYYTVKDGEGNVSNQALVTIDYNQQPPVAVNDLDPTPNAPGTNGTVNATANDTDPNNDLDVSSVNLIASSVPGGAGTDTDSDGDIDQVV